MNPVQTEFTTRILGAPVGWNEEKNGKCIGLPIIDSTDQMLSIWRPSLKDRLKILFGVPLCLSIFSAAHPPVWLSPLSEIIAPDGRLVTYRKFMKKSKDAKL